MSHGGTFYARVSHEILELLTSLFFLEVEVVAFIIDEAKVSSDGCEAEIGVICAKQETIFCTRGEHAVGFAWDFGDEVVHENAEVCFIATETNEVFVIVVTNGIEAGEEALAACFFVT